jgi:ApaG protein
LERVTRSDALTEGVRVRVEARYSPDHSDPRRSEWFFLYTITLTNEGDATCQLLTRHWIIENATGKVEEVQGPGVVGEQPVLEPGGSFEYTSGCPLDTPFGSMRGTYQMIREDGSEFEAEIARFELREPGAVH